MARLQVLALGSIKLARRHFESWRDFAGLERMTAIKRDNRCAGTSDGAISLNIVSIARSALVGAVACVLITDVLIPYRHWIWNRAFQRAVGLLILYWGAKLRIVSKASDMLKIVSIGLFALDNTYISGIESFIQAIGNIVFTLIRIDAWFHDVAWLL
jgi:hypothetical protein